MIVSTRQNRVVSLRGMLKQDVDFGFGILGELKKGGNLRRRANSDRAGQLGDHGNPHPYTRSDVALQQHQATCNPHTRRGNIFQAFREYLHELRLQRLPAELLFKKVLPEGNACV